MAIQPTAAQIESAKDFIRRRVEAEVSMKNNLTYLLERAMQRLTNIAALNNLTLEELLKSTIYKIRVQVQRVIDWVIETLEDYTETLATASSKEDSRNVIPYIHRDIKGKTFDDRLEEYVNGYFFGDNHKKSMNSLLLLTSYAVADGWMRSLYLKGVRDGSKGFYSFRGSSYPCDLCDSMTGFHPIEDYVGLWHPNCKCYFIFI